MDWNEYKDICELISKVRKEIEDCMEDNMNIFCRPELTLTDIEDAEIFFRECSTILDQYIYNLRYIGSQTIMRQVMLESASSDDILIFFTAERKMWISFWLWEAAV